MSGVQRRPAIRSLFPQMGRWTVVAASDPEAVGLLRAYRSSWLGRSDQLSTIGRKALTLVTPQSDALCCWKPDPLYAMPDAVRLVVLHNRSRRRVWKLVNDAATHARDRWPQSELYALLDRRAQATRAKTLTRSNWADQGRLVDGQHLWVCKER